MHSFGFKLSNCYFVVLVPRGPNPLGTLALSFDQRHLSSGFPTRSEANRAVQPHIMQTCLCNVYPLTPHLYIEKLGFTGVFIIFLFLLIEAVLTCTHNQSFEQK